MENLLTVDNSLLVLWTNQEYFIIEEVVLDPREPFCHSNPEIHMKIERYFFNESYTL